MQVQRAILVYICTFGLASDVTKMYPVYMFVKLFFPLFSASKETA
jgi:hypothetical protein